MQNNKIYFYEWSDINSQPKVFERYIDFHDFCIENGIKLTRAKGEAIFDREVSHVICKPGCPEIVISGDYRNLKKNFSKAKKRQHARV